MEEGQASSGYIVRELLKIFMSLLSLRLFLDKLLGYANLNQGRSL